MVGQLPSQLLELHLTSSKKFYFSTKVLLSSFIQLMFPTNPNQLKCPINQSRELETHTHQKPKDMILSYLRLRFQTWGRNMVIIDQNWTKRDIRMWAGINLGSKYVADVYFPFWAGHKIAAVQSVSNKEFGNWYWEFSNFVIFPRKSFSWRSLISHR